MTFRRIAYLGLALLVLGPLHPAHSETEAYAVVPAMRIMGQDAQRRSDVLASCAFRQSSTLQGLFGWVFEVSPGSEYTLTLDAGPLGPWYDVPGTRLNIAFYDRILDCEDGEVTPLMSATATLWSTASGRVPPRAASAVVTARASFEIGQNMHCWDGECIATPGAGLDGRGLVRFRFIG